MNRYVLGLALCLALFATQAPGQARRARADIIGVARGLEAGKNVDAKVAAIRGRYDDLEYLMAVYKPRNKGGIGFGPPAKNDSIELKIQNLGNAALAPAALAKEKADLIKLAYLTIAMGRITHKFAGRKKPALWHQYSTDTEKHGKELLAELRLKAPNPNKVRGIAANLTRACAGCHNDIRDD
jgi:hypothetical protein